MTGYCPNCGGAIEHDGENADCEHCEIHWRGNAARALKPEPFAPGELEAFHAEQMRRFEETHPRGPIV